MSRTRNDALNKRARRSQALIEVERRITTKGGSLPSAEQDKRLATAEAEKTILEQRLRRF